MTRPQSPEAEIAELQQQVLSLERIAKSCGAMADTRTAELFAVKASLNQVIAYVQHKSICKANTSYTTCPKGHSVQCFERAKDYCDKCGVWFKVTKQECTCGLTTLLASQDSTSRKD